MMGSYGEIGSRHVAKSSRSLKKKIHSEFGLENGLGCLVEGEFWEVLGELTK